MNLHQKLNRYVFYVMISISIIVTFGLIGNFQKVIGKGQSLTDRYSSEWSSPVYQRHLNETGRYLNGERNIDDYSDMMVSTDQGFENVQDVSQLDIVYDSSSTTCGYGCDTSTGGDSTCTRACNTSSGTTCGYDCSTSSEPTTCEYSCATSSNTTCGYDCSTSGGSTPQPTPDPAVTAAQQAAAAAQAAEKEAQQALDEAVRSGNPAAIAQAAQEYVNASQAAATAQQNYNQALTASTSNNNQATDSQNGTIVTANKDLTPGVADPVKIATGAFTTAETDLEYTLGNIPVSVSRNYQSDRTSSHSFGPVWSFNYDMRIVTGVRPNAGAEAEYIQKLYEEAEQKYQEQAALVSTYNAQYTAMDNAWKDALEAQGLAAEFVTKAINAQTKANATHNPYYIQQADELYQQAVTMKGTADGQVSATANAKQKIIYCLAKVTELDRIRQDLKPLAEQSRREANLADSNHAKNVYVQNSTDPSDWEYSGNSTVTFIDGGGLPHLYLIETQPDFNSTVKYPNGKPNYYPNGAICKTAVPFDNKLELLADGTYRMTNKDLSQYLFNFYGQIAAIIDSNGNRLDFKYNSNHNLEKITDSYNRQLVFQYENGKVVKITDPKGREVSFTYNSEGLLAGRKDPGGDSISYTYDGSLITQIGKPDGSNRNYYYKDLNGEKVVDYFTDEEGNRVVFNYFPGGMYSEFHNASGILERQYYNDRYLTTKIEYGDGSFVTMDYDNDNNMTYYRNQLGQVYQYGYDQNHNVVQAIDPEGRSEQWTYTEFNKVKTYTDKMGQITQYSYDTKGNLTGVEYPDGSTVALAYDDRGRMIESTDQLKNKTVYGYDPNGYIAAIKDPRGNIERFDNDVLGNIVKYTDQAGNPTVYEYNNDNKIIKVTDCEGNSEAYTYNNRKDLIQVTDKNDKITTYEYDKRHLLIKTTNPLGETVDYQYRPDQQKSGVVLSSDNHIQYTHDYLGNLTAVTQVETGATTKYEYNAAKQIVAVVDPNGNRTEYGYTPMGLVHFVKDPAGNFKRFEYNANGKAIAVTDERGGFTRYDYDKMNRVIKVTDPNNNTMQYTYDLKGNLTGVTDKNGNLQSFEYDPLGQVIQETDPMGGVKQWAYDSRGVVISQIDPNGEKTAYQYDRLKKLIKTTDPLNGVKQYSYDPMGNLLTATDPNGVTTSYQYDALNRLVAVSDAQGNKTQYQYNYLGKVTKKTDALNNSTTFDYDALGRLVKQTDALGAATVYAYDGNGNLTQVTDPEGNSQSYQYDGLNRLAATIDALNQKTGYRYDAGGNLVELINPKGQIYSYEYDPAGRLVREKDFLGQTKGYTLDPNGNPIAQTDFNGNTIEYKYDKLNRLVTAKYPDGSQKQLGYDPLGNLTSAINGSITETYEYDPLSRLVKAETTGLNPNGPGPVAFRYDKAGNPIAVITGQKHGPSRTTAYRYDDLNRLTQVTLPDGGVISFTYDALNRVAEKTNANQTVTVYGYTPRGEVETIVNYSDRRRNRVLDAEGYLYNPRGERIYELKENGDLTAYRYDAAGDLSKVYYPLYSKKPIEDLKERRYFGLGLDLETLNSFKAGVPQYSGTEVDDLAAEISAVVDPLANGIYYSTPVTDTKVKKYWDGSVESGQAPPPRVEGLALGEKPLPAANSLDLGNQATDLAGLYRKISGRKFNFDMTTRFWAEEFTYDSNGNVQLKRNGWGEISYQYNAANQLTQVGKRFYQYDRNGNLIREALGDGFADYRYNYENRLVNVNNRFRDLLSDQSFIGEVNYQYDAFGRKVGKELIPAEGSKKEREYYLYNGLGTDILAEYQDETGNGFSRGRNPSQVREYYYGNGLLLAQKLYLLEGIGDPRHRLSWTNATLDLICYSQDALGSVTLITGQGGKVLGKYRYDAYGNAYNGRFEGCVFGEDEFDNFWDWDNDESVAAATSDGFTAQGWGWPGIGYGWGHYKHGRSWGILRQGNVYGFTGERFEPELGVYSFTFRDYNPRTMRWMTKDPIKDGTNWYQYCNGDPVNWVDLLGLEDDCTIGPQPENTFETYTTKWTAGATTVDDGIYIQPVASVRTEVVGNVDVESDGKNVNVELDAAIGATSSLNPEAGITVDVNVTVEVNLVNKEGEIVDTESVYVGSTEAKVPGASPEEMFDTRVNDEEIQLTLPDGANPSDYSVKVTITGSFGNADGESFVVPRSFEKDAITVPVCNKSSK